MDLAKSLLAVLLPMGALHSGSVALRSPAVSLGQSFALETSGRIIATGVGPCLALSDGTPLSFHFESGANTLVGEGSGQRLRIASFRQREAVLCAWSKAPAGLFLRIQLRGATKRIASDTKRQERSAAQSAVWQLQDGFLALGVSGARLQLGTREPGIRFTEKTPSIVLVRAADKKTLLHRLAVLRLMDASNIDRQRAIDQAWLKGGAALLDAPAACLELRERALLALRAQLTSDGTLLDYRSGEPIHADAFSWIEAAAAFHVAGHEAERDRIFRAYSRPTRSELARLKQYERLFALSRPDANTERTREADATVARCKQPSLLGHSLPARTLRMAIELAELGGEAQDFAWIEPRFGRVSLVLEPLDARPSALLFALVRSSPKDPALRLALAASAPRALRELLYANGTLGLRAKGPGPAPASRAASVSGSAWYAEWTASHGDFDSAWAVLDSLAGRILSKGRLATIPESLGPKTIGAQQSLRAAATLVLTMHRLSRPPRAWKMRQSWQLPEIKVYPKRLRQFLGGSAEYQERFAECLASLRLLAGVQPRVLRVDPKKGKDAAREQLPYLEALRRQALRDFLEKRARKR